MNLTKTLVLNVVSIVTIASLITACCGLPAREEDGGQQPTTTVEAYPVPTGVASGPVEVVSERELTPDEFFQAVEGDESFADVYALAAEQGYTEPGEASEAIASDGSEVQALLLSSPEGDNIGVFRIGRPGLTNSLLARPERGGEALVLYDREGGVEISEEGFSIFDAAGDPIAETPLQEGRRTAALGPWADDCKCGGRWHDFDHCLGETYIGWESLIGVWSGCAVGALTFGAGVTAGGMTGGLSAAGGFLTFVALCPPLAVCEGPMRTDDPPIVTFAHREVLDTVCEQCSEFGGEAIWTSQKVRVHYKVDDDRMMVLIKERAVDVCGTETPRVSVYDCCLRETFTTDFDPVRDGDLVAADLQGCADGEACVQVSKDKAECTRVEAPISSGVCSTPGAWCVVEGRFDLPEIPGIPIPRNEVKIAFPVDGGPVSGNFYLALIVDETFGGEVCIERWDYFGTLSGHFDPESGRLEGLRDDWSLSSEVLEGCEDSEGEFDDPGAISWWATYDWTTGELEGEWVDPAEEEVTLLRGISVSEEPSNPLD